MTAHDILGQLGVDVDIGFGWIGDIVIFLVVAALIGVATFIYASKKSYNKSIIKYREIDGITRKTGTERAKEIVLPGTSVRAFYLKSSGFFIPRPSIETGINEYWYFVRKDGEWMNIGIENVNEKLKELGLHFDHTDMRMANAALKRLVDKSYKKINWLKEYAPYIGFGVIIIMVSVGGYLVMGESSKVVSAAALNVEALAKITETMNSLLGNINNIASSSGVSTA